jgi:hypothetical protein
MPAASSSPSASVTAADSQGSLRGSASYRPSPERHGWPFYAVIGGAALVGSIVVMFAMRSDWASSGAASATPPDPAVRAADSPSSAPSPAGAISVVPIDPVVDSPAGGASDPASAKPIVDDRSGGAVATPTIHDRNADATAKPLPNPLNREGAAKPIVNEHSSDAADRAAATSRPRAPKAIAPRGAPAATAPTATAPTATAPTATAPTAAVTSPLAATATALSKRDRDDAIARSYAAELYGKVLEQCGAGPVNADHAPLCFLAACHLGNAAKASKLLAAVPTNRRDQLVTNCRQLGVDIKKAETVDCEADPMACQH